MSQKFQVLRCFECETFQVHIIKKVKKWECKMCGVKQSVIRIYVEGSSKECRIHVQELNKLRFIRKSSPNVNGNIFHGNSSYNCHLNETSIDEENLLKNNIIIDKNNKWNVYIEDLTHCEIKNKSTFFNCNGKRENEANDFASKKFRLNMNKDELKQVNNNKSPNNIKNSLSIFPEKKTSSVSKFIWMKYMNNKNSIEPQELFENDFYQEELVNENSVTDVFCKKMYENLNYSKHIDFQNTHKININSSQKMEIEPFGNEGLFETNENKYDLNEILKI